MKGPDNHVTTFISLSDQRSHGKSSGKKVELENRPEYVFKNYQQTHMCKHCTLTRDPLLYTTVVSICTDA